MSFNQAALYSSDLDHFYYPGEQYTEAPQIYHYANELLFLIAPLVFPHQ